MWCGDLYDLPKVHDNEEKRRMTSVIDVLHLPTGRWEQRSTNGKPPLGVWSYASTVIGNRIFYFGGYCNHDHCHHNCLHSLSTVTLTWNEHFSSNSRFGPMMKSACCMIPTVFYKEDYHVLIVGGYGIRPNIMQSGAEYSDKFLYNHRYVRTNEHHYYQLASGKKINILSYQHQVQFCNCVSGHWIVPDISGQTPPPCDDFTLTSLSNNRALLFGGKTPSGRDNTVYIAECTITAVVSISIICTVT